LIPFFRKITGSVVPEKNCAFAGRHGEKGDEKIDGLKQISRDFLKCF
jgi:hypothetical protein